MKNNTIKSLAVMIAAASGSTALAQTGPALEEILVTAQKREQSLMDVPVSVNTLSGEKIAETGIANMEGMADYIPSFNITQTGIGTTISIRGISSGVNQGFEQSTAQFVDGVHFGRAQQARAPFLDVERVEVLRGPQSILFGKNSTAGAVSITSAQPTRETTGSITGLYEPNHGERDIRAVVSGPMSDQFSARVAMLDRSMDGYMRNTTLGRDEAQEQDRVIRATFNWDPSPDWHVSLKLEDASFDREGRNLEVIEPTTLEGGVAYADVLANLTSQLTGGTNVYHLDTQQDFRRQSLAGYSEDNNPLGDYSENNSRHGILTIETLLGDHTLTSISGYTQYDYEELCNCDFVGVPLINIASAEDYSQWSQELRLASPLDQPISYLGGLFLQSSNLTFDDATRVPDGSFLPPALEAGGIAGASLLNNTSSQRAFEQDSDLWALFAQVTWNVTNELNVTFGGRYTDEEKTASRRQFHVANGQELPIGSPSDPHNTLFGLFNIEPYDTITDTRNESGFTPSVIVQYDLNPTDMVYASYTTGYKSGGFDVRSNAHPDPTVNNAFNVRTGEPMPITGVFQFEEEKVTNYELGGKFSLAGGAAELNVALFQSEFTDLQTSQFDGAFSFNVTNAAEATVRGVEVDGRWLLTHNLILSGGLAWLDFEYDRFPTAQCYFGQAQPGVTRCDASGKRREFTPEWQGNLGLNHHVSLGRMGLNSTLDLIYSDDYYTAPTLDPRMRQDSYVKVNARVALQGEGDRWELALIGKNLTDQAIVTHANGLPIATVLTQNTGTAYYAFYERPRSVALQGTLRF
ncbi:TonB-dependent receptor [Marinimicrobium sp. ABcell2]|uniref:TonB-dependent receptor n=1 Tax=Marinimicrobium sp. ABcell2 TaxID=3069751 RepID=UPI0027B5CCB7|nr:TonB-dependent receptor [Marinimicrobium sp. ABcell2]MDQ2075077.1 TonB-dependent receptor [Marinimicrobium sp. ABcell2]